MTRPLILYIPGLLPKPDAEVHRDALWRCLKHGVRTADSDVGDALDHHPNAFELVSWTYDFYREHRDFAIDAESIERLLERRSASHADKKEATSFGRRLLIRLYLLGDWMPFLIPWLANERIEMHIRDLNRYAFDEDGIASSVREQLVGPLRAARREGRPVLLVAHSMGSVIAWDVLWELTHRDCDPLRLDLLLTMGSPLGQRYIQRRISGAEENGDRRYPQNIRRWINVSAWGDLTAIDPHLANDFGEMQRRGHVQSIEDKRIFNWFRLDGILNVHAEYGYFANPSVGAAIAEFWRKHDRELC